MDVDDTPNIDDKSSLILIATNNSRSAFEVSRDCNLPLSTTYRKLDTLLQHNLIKISGEISNGKRFLRFTNNTKNNCFKNPHRVLSILNTISRNPGISFRDVLRISGLTNGVISHYLNQLQKKGLIQVRRNKRKIWLFTSEVPGEEMNLIIHLRNDTSRAIVSSLLDDRCVTFYDLTKMINRCPASISIRLSRLVRDGFVKKTEGPHGAYFLKNPRFVSRIMSAVDREARIVG